MGTPGGTKKTKFFSKGGEWRPDVPEGADGWPEGESPALKLIWVRYKDAGLLDWDNHRVGSICRQIKCTPYELCAAAGLFDTREVRFCWRDEKWPAYLTIHFRKIEDAINRVKFMEEPAVGPGPEDIEMARLIARRSSDPKVQYTSLDCVATDGCKATTVSIKQDQ